MSKITEHKKTLLKSTDMILKTDFQNKNVSFENFSHECLVNRQSDRATIIKTFLIQLVSCFPRLMTVACPNEDHAWNHFDVESKNDF